MHKILQSWLTSAASILGFDQLLVDWFNPLLTQEEADHAKSIANPSVYGYDQKTLNRFLQKSLTSEVQLSDPVPFVIQVFDFADRPGMIAL